MLIDALQVLLEVLLTLLPFLELEFGLSHLIVAGLHIQLGSCHEHAYFPLCCGPDYQNGTGPICEGPRGLEPLNEMGDGLV